MPVPLHDLPIVGMVVTTVDQAHVEKMLTVRCAIPYDAGANPDGNSQLTLVTCASLPSPSFNL